MTRGLAAKITQAFGYVFALFLVTIASGSRAWEPNIQGI